MLHRSRPSARSRWPAAPLAGLLTLGLLGACAEEQAPPPEVVRPIKVLTIRGGGGQQLREYPGTVRAAQTAEMAFEVSGKIVEFVYREGARVEEGALLARLDSRDYQAQFDAVEADFENSRVNYERAQKLFESGAMAELERDRRRTTMMENEAKLRTASKALEDTELRAPFAGTMARKLVQDFENVRAKQNVLILTDDSYLELKLDVPERDMAGDVDDGQVDTEDVTERTHPRVVITSIPDRVFPARFTEIATTADTETRTFEVTATFDRVPGVSILPGMTAKLLVDVIERRPELQGIRIPGTATAADDSGAPYVWLVDTATNTVSERNVTLGELVGGDVLVTDGLEDGDVIAISGVSQLRPGMTIRPLATN